MTSDVVKSNLRGAVGVIGAAIAGPVGAMVGTFLGSMAGSLLPGIDEFAKRVFTNLGSKGIESLSLSVEERLSDRDRQQINHDLQTAFRDALREAIFDVGGVQSFPILARRGDRDVPYEVIFFNTAPGHYLLHTSSPLAAQIKILFQEMLSALDDQKILPLDPPKKNTNAGVKPYLESQTPSELSAAFFESNITHFLEDYSILLSELPDLESHLRHYLFDRTLVHLSEFLKQRTPAWRAFNRLILEILQKDINEISKGQSQILQKIDQLLAASHPEGLLNWSETLSEFISASGKAQARMDESFDALTQRVLSQHHELLSRFEQLSSSAERIETKVDRVLRYISTGQAGVDSEQPTLPQLKPPAPGAPPYKGLQSFIEADAEWFYGREKLIARIIQRLQDSPFLAVIGASGSGKSSVVRAGVIPVLSGKKQLSEVPFLPHNAQQWPVFVMTPTNHPIDSLAACFSRESTSLPDISLLSSDLHKDPSGFDLVVRREANRHNSERLLLVIDQFEELFTLCQDDLERRAFINAVIEHQNRAKVALVIIVLRADFYANCALYASLRQAISICQEYIGPMNKDELRCAIEEPARKGNWRFEPGLVDLFIKDVGDEPGALPLLSHALLETWYRRSGRTMTLESYAESGGVRGAIAKTAEMVYNQRLNSDQRLIAQNIFLRLTNLGEGAQYTRRRAALDELITSPEQTVSVEGVLMLLTEARLITTEGGFAQVAHEALFREWPKLNGWLDDNREELRLHRRLTESSLEWQRFGRDEDLLYRGSRLSEATEWAAAHPDQPNELERVFLNASQEVVHRQTAEREAQQKRELESAQKLAQSEATRAEEQSRAATKLKIRGKNLRAALIGVGILAIIAIILGFFAFSSLQTATQAALEAEQQSRISFVRELAARSGSVLDRDQDLAILLASKAVTLSRQAGTGEIREAQTALYQSLEKANFFQTLRCHTDRVNLAVYSPDNKRIASSSKDGSVCIWDAQGQLIEKLELGGEEIYTAIFSPDSKQLVITGNLPDVRIWKENSPLVILKGHSAPVSFAEFSPDGNRILTASWDKTAKIWKPDGTLETTLAGHTQMLSIARFSPDGKRVATASLDNSIILWQIDGMMLRQFTGHTALISSLVFSPDSSRLLSASWDGSAKIWTQEGGLFKTLVGHTQSINSIAVNSDGSLIVTASYDNTARLWNNDGTQISVLRGHTGTVNSAVFSGDGQKIITASNDSTARLWNLDGSQIAILRGHSNWVTIALFNFDSTRVITSGWDNTIRIWKMDELFDNVLEGHTAPVSDALFSPDDLEILTASSDSTIRFWAQDGSFISSFAVDIGPVNSAQFSRDGKSILLSGTKNVAALYDRKGQKLTTFTGHTDMVDGAIFSPDSKFVVTFSGDNTARIWKSDGTPLFTLEHPDSINGIAINPKGDSFASAGTDYTTRLYSMDGKLLQSIITEYPSCSVAFTTDGSTILIGDSTGSIFFYSINGNLKKKLSAHNDIVTSINPSKDGDYFVSTGVDGSVMLWKISGEFISSLEGHTTWVTKASINASNTKIVTASWDGTIRLWGMHGDITSMLSIATKRVDRNLNERECLRYLRMEKCE